MKSRFLLRFLLLTKDLICDLYVEVFPNASPNCPPDLVFNLPKSEQKIVGGGGGGGDLPWKFWPGLMYLLPSNGSCKSVQAVLT